ncbi:MAG: hypothetical protein ACRERU_19470 [Methylococcales bacterium]
MPENPQTMLIRSILIATLLSVSSCATQKQAIEKTPAPTEEPAESEISEATAPNAPPQTLFKNGEKLRLVRVMDGGACNSEDQGARGLFLLYAEPKDIEKIKKQKGTKVFEQFEHDIESLSLQALQESIGVINFADNPFALDVEDALGQVVQQLIAHFKKNAASPIENFESNSGLTIDVVPFSPSVGFLLENCNATLHDTSESR